MSPSNFLDAQYSCVVIFWNFIIFERNKLEAVQELREISIHIFAARITVWSSGTAGVSADDIMHLLGRKYVFKRLVQLVGFLVPQFEIVISQFLDPSKEICYGNFLFSLKIGENFPFPSRGVKLPEEFK